MAKSFRGGPGGAGRRLAAAGATRRRCSLTSSRSRGGRWSSPDPSLIPVWTARLPPDSPLAAVSRSWPIPFRVRASRRASARPLLLPSSAPTTIFLRVPEVVSRLVPDLIIRVGRSPTSPALEAALAQWHRSTQIVVDDGAHRKDYQGLASHYLHASAGAALEHLASEEEGEKRPSPETYRSWTRKWTDLEAGAWAAVEEDSPHRDNEGDYAAALIRALPQGATLFVSSSMPVRDVDAYGRPAPLDIQVLGEPGCQRHRRGRLDRARLCGGRRRAGCRADRRHRLLPRHERPARSAGPEAERRLRCGRQRRRRYLPHAAPSAISSRSSPPYFATPHGLDFRHAARLYGLPFTDAADPAELGRAVKEAAAQAGTQVVRVRTDREANRRRHERVRARVVRRLQQQLKQEKS